MSSLPHLHKIRKAKRSKATETENEVAKAIYDLQLSHKAMKDVLPRFHFNTAKKVEVVGAKKQAVLVFYPLRFVMLVRKLQKTMVAEMEKRFAGSSFFFVAQRKIVKRPNDVYKLQDVQRSRTATAVNEAILEDLLYPADIVGRRWRFRTDGSRVMKIYLDARDRKKMDARLVLAAALYKKLTHRARLSPPS
jgi:small subunit ribosomal protein S7e